MPDHGLGRIYRRPDGKYFIYIPARLQEDTAFPLKIPEKEKSMKVAITFNGTVLTIQKAE